MGELEHLLSFANGRKSKAAKVLVLVIIPLAFV
jgi:hypothetical protein